MITLYVCVTQTAAVFCPFVYSVVSCHVMSFQGERYRDPVCRADGVLSLPERRVARHPQGTLLLL